ncbi:MAG TPA: hypothetical protein VGR89_06600, partial [Puia sp.]|nr:hypothetical protein [Puia sp.]
MPQTLAVRGETGILLHHQARGLLSPAHAFFPYFCLYQSIIILIMAEIIVELKHCNIYQGDSLILQDVNLVVEKA